MGASSRRACSMDHQHLNHHVTSLILPVSCIVEEAVEDVVEEAMDQAISPRRVPRYVESPVVE
jgi:hypothetical protein